MSNITNLESFLQEPKQFTLGGQIFTVNESSTMYLKWKTEMMKLEKEGNTDDELKIFEIAYKYAFGKDKAKELLNLEYNGQKLPIAVFNQIYTEILEAWTGQKITPSEK